MSTRARRACLIFGAKGGFSAEHRRGARRCRIGSSWRASWRMGVVSSQPTPAGGRRRSRWPDWRSARCVWSVPRSVLVRVAGSPQGWSCSLRPVPFASSFGWRPRTPISPAGRKKGRRARIGSRPGSSPGGLRAGGSKSSSQMYALSRKGMSPVDGAPEATLRSFRDACCFRSPRTKRSRGRSDSCATGRAFGSSLVCRRSRAPGIRAASTARGPGRVVGSRSGVGSLIHPGSWRSASLARDRRRSVVVSWTGSRRGSRSKGAVPSPSRWCSATAARSSRIRRPRFAISVWPI